MALFVFVCDFNVDDQFIVVIVKGFYRVLEFNAVEPSSVYEFPDLCDELTGPF